MRAPSLRQWAVLGFVFAASAGVQLGRTAFLRAQVAPGGCPAPMRCAMSRLEFDCGPDGRPGTAPGGGIVRCGQGLRGLCYGCWRNGVFGPPNGSGSGGGGSSGSGGGGGSGGACLKNMCPRGCMPGRSCRRQVNLCGNGKLDGNDAQGMGGEGCDPPNVKIPGQPNADPLPQVACLGLICQVARECGNGIVEDPEECDEGPDNGGDYCKKNCKLQTGAERKPCTPWDPIDDPNQGAASCRTHALGYQGDPVCGNSRLEPPEQCDFGPSGNRGRETGCNPDCTVPDFGDTGGGGDRAGGDTGSSGGEEVGARTCTECVSYSAHKIGSSFFPVPPTKSCGAMNLRGDPHVTVLEVTRAGKVLYMSKAGVHIYDFAKNTITDYKTFYGTMVTGWSDNLRWFVLEEVMASRPWYDKTGAKYYLLDRRTNQKFPLPVQMGATAARVSDDGTLVAAVQGNPTDTTRQKKAYVWDRIGNIVRQIDAFPVGDPFLAEKERNRRGTYWQQIEADRHMAKVYITSEDWLLRNDPILQDDTYASRKLNLPYTGAYNNKIVYIYDVKTGALSRPLGPDGRLNNYGDPLITSVQLSPSGQVGVNSWQPNTWIPSMNRYVNAWLVRYADIDRAVDNGYVAEGTDAERRGFAGSTDVGGWKVFLNRVLIDTSLGNPQALVGTFVSDAGAPQISTRNIRYDDPYLAYSVSMEGGSPNSHAIYVEEVQTGKGKMIPTACYPPEQVIPNVPRASTCGNGVLERDEQCDAGGQNGAAGGNCSKTCAIVKAPSCELCETIPSEDRCQLHFGCAWFAQTGQCKATENCGAGAGIDVNKCYSCRTIPGPANAASCTSPCVVAADGRCMESPTLCPADQQRCPDTCGYKLEGTGNTHRLVTSHDGSYVAVGVRSRTGQDIHNPALPDRSTYYAAFQVTPTAVRMAMPKERTVGGAGANPDMKIDGYDGDDTVLDDGQFLFGNGVWYDIIRNAAKTWGATNNFDQPRMNAASATLLSNGYGCIHPYDMAKMEVMFPLQLSQQNAAIMLCRVITYRLGANGRVVAVRWRGASGETYRELWKKDSPLSPPVRLAAHVEVRSELSQNTRRDVSMSPNGSYAAFFGVEPGQQTKLYLVNLENNAVAPMAIKTYTVPGGTLPRGEVASILKVTDAGDIVVARTFTANNAMVSDIARIAQDGTRTVLASGRFMYEEAVSDNGDFLIVPSDGGLTMPPVRKKIVHVSAQGVRTVLWSDQQPEPGTAETYTMWNSTLSGDGKVAYVVINKSPTEQRLIRFDVNGGAVTRRTIYGDAASCAAAVPVCN